MAFQQVIKSKFEFMDKKTSVLTLNLGIKKSAYCALLFASTQKILVIKTKMFWC